jgi:GT2 family glycosyltransferase
MDLSIIIVNYNVRYYVEQCLRSIEAASASLDVEVFVVDNASSDRSTEYLRRRFPRRDYPQLHIVANARNVGFGKANNQVLSRAQGRYVLYLNPDTLLGEHVLEQSVAFADAHKDLGALGVMMLHTNGAFALESRRGLPTPWVSFCKMSGLSALFPRSRSFGRYYMRYLNLHQPASIDIVSGAFMMIPRVALEQEGAFDERFFMYGEDIDLSYRLLKSGRQNYYIPAPILHYKGESTHKSTYRYVHVFYGAMLLFFKKHYRHYSWLMAIPVQVAILLKALIELLWRQMRHFRYFLFPHREGENATQLYLGSHGAEIRKIAEQWGLNISCVATDEAHLAPGEAEALVPKGCVHIIYDLDDFSRETVLSRFYSSQHRYHIGTYATRTKVLITGSRAYPLKQDWDD